VFIDSKQGRQWRILNSEDFLAQEKHLVNFNDKYLISTRKLSIATNVHVESHSSQQWLDQPQEDTKLQKLFSF